MQQTPISFHNSPALAYSGLNSQFNTVQHLTRIKLEKSSIFFRQPLQLHKDWYSASRKESLLIPASSQSNFIRIRDHHMLDKKLVIPYFDDIHLQRVSANLKRSMS